MTELSSAGFISFVVGWCREISIQAVAQAQCCQRLKFCRSCMIQKGASLISRFASVGDRDGTGTVGMAVSNKLTLGFCFARVGKRQACKIGQSVRHTAGFLLFHTVEISHI